MSDIKYKPMAGRLDSKMWGLCLIGLYCLLAISPVIIVYVSTEPLDDPLLVTAALITAMIGFSLLCLQVILAGRFKTVDRPFGLDVVMQFHRKMAVFALFLLVLHPILLAIGHNSFVLFGLQTSWKVNLGKAALLFLIIGVLFALYFHKMKVDYNVWRFMHKGMVIVVILGFLHGLVIGPHINQSPFVRTYWYVMFLTAVFVFGFRNLIIPFVRRKFKVASVNQETHDTYTLTFEPEDGKPTYRNPGQFMFLKLIRPGRSSELHPFTISASPLKADILQATVKQSGNFTNTIGQTMPGDVGKIEAPFGRFSYIYDAPAKILFIAGGVGITPIISMIRCLRDSGDSRAVTLLYGNKTEKGIIFREEIEELPDNFNAVYILSNPDENWQGERGYITTEIINKYAGEALKDAHIYLCGPPVMMDKIIKSLRELKVSDKRIHYERFTI